MKKILILLLLIPFAGSAQIDTCYYCVGDIATLTTTITGEIAPLTYSWVCDDGQTFSTASPDITLTQSTRCVLTAIDSVACEFNEIIDLLIYDDPVTSIELIDCALYWVDFETLANCLEVLEEFDGTNWNYYALLVDGYSLAGVNGTFRLKSVCDCGDYFGPPITVACGVQCNDFGASCDFTNDILTLTPEDASIYTITSDVLEWRKVHPVTNAALAGEAWQTYTTPLQDCDIKETITVDWKALNNCTTNSTSYIGLGYNSVTTCAGNTADVEYTFNGSTVSQTDQVSKNLFENESSFIANGPKTFTVFEGTAIGIVSTSGAYTYAGNGVPPDCNDLSWAVTNPPNEIYYTIEWRRTLTTSECGVNITTGYCVLGACAAVSVSATCDATSIIATATGCVGTPIYNFYKAGALLQTGTSNTLLNPTSGNHVVEVVCDGCTVQTTTDCVIACTASATISLSGICQLVISNITNCAGYSLQWYLDNVPISGATGTTYSVMTNGNYSLRITGCTNCNTITSNTVIVNGCEAACIASVNISETNCSLIAAVSNCSGTPSYSWSTGATTQSIAVTVDGTYSVTVTGCCQVVTDSYVVTGCVPNPCVGYSVNVNPGNTQTVCDNDPQLFPFTAGVVNGNGGYSFVWRLNGTQVSTSSTYTFNSSGRPVGSYQIEVQITDSQGCFDNDFVSVLVQDCNDPCIMSINIAPDNQTICEGDVEVYTVTVSNGTPPYSYQWRRNGTLVSTSSTYATGPPDGAYTITLDVTDAAGCDATDQTSLTVQDACICGTTGCNLTLVLSTCNLTWGTCPNYISILQYNSGSGWFAVAGNPQGSYTSTISASYRLLWTRSGCTSFSTNTVNTTCTPTCTIGVNITPNYAALCEGTSALFSGSITNGSGSYVYEWKVNGTVVSNAATYNSSLPVGNSTVALTVTDNADGCTATDSDIIAVSDFCVCGDDVCNIILTKTGCVLTWPSCPGFNVFLNYKAPGGTYQPVVGATSPYTAEMDGDYNLSITRSGCLNQISNAVIVAGCTVCNIAISPLPTISYCSGESYTFVPTVTGGTPPIGYTWKVNGVTASMSENFVFTRTQGSYTILLEVEDGNGCIDTESTTATVYNSLTGALLFSYNNLTNRVNLPLNVCEFPDTYTVQGFASASHFPITITSDSPRFASGGIVVASTGFTMDFSALIPGEIVEVTFTDTNGCVKTSTYNRCCQCDAASNCECSVGSDPCNVTFAPGTGGFNNDDIFEYIVYESGQLLLELEPLSIPQTISIWKNNVLLVTHSSVVASNNQPACGNDVSTNGIICPSGGTITELNCYALNAALPADYLAGGATAFKSFELCLGPINSCTPTPSTQDRAGYQFPISSGDIIKIDINHPGCTVASDWTLISNCNP